MRWIFLFSILQLTFLGLQAQDETLPKSTFHLKLGGGFGYQTLRDDAMSPLLYDGVQGGFMAGGEWRRPQSLYLVDALFWTGETSARSGWSTTNYSFTVNGAYLRNLSIEEARWHWRLGGALTTWGSFRNHQGLINSDFFYDIFFSVGPTAMVERDFQLFHRDWMLYWQLIVPMLTYGARPNYSGLDVAPPDDKSFHGFDDAQIGSFNILQNVKSRIELAFPLKNGNRLGVMYYWDYFKSDLKPFTVRQSMQSLQFNLHFQL